jgi:hypothetical protein
LTGKTLGAIHLIVPDSGGNPAEMGRAGALVKDASMKVIRSGADRKEKQRDETEYSYFLRETVQAAPPFLHPPEHCHFPLLV